FYSLDFVCWNCYLHSSVPVCNVSVRRKLEQTMSYTYRQKSHLHLTLQHPFNQSLSQMDHTFLCKIKEPNHYASLTQDPYLAFHSNSSITNLQAKAKNLDFG
ncbi:hypothetical protein S83_056798, partial [Arachis hypogaea]